MVNGARFCHACGRPSGSRPTGNGGQQTETGGTTLLDLPLPPSAPLGPATETVGSSESVTFAAGGPVFIGEKRWKVSVTERRVLLWRNEGLIAQKKSIQEIDPKLVARMSLREEGSVFREHFLQLDDLTMRGRKADLENLYRAIVTVRNRDGTH